MTRTLHITLITRTLGIHCRVLGPCPWCYRADTATHRQLTQHACPGQPATRLPPTRADQVMAAVGQLGVEIYPWQERAIRALYPTTPPTQPCSCWYAPAVTEVQYGTYDYVWRFTINPRCPQHGAIGAR